MSTTPDLKPNLNCPIDQQINVLLLGPTGVGKTTFINAFANYIVHNTIEEAENDEMQIIIPSSFAFTVPETFDEKRITLGNEDEYEKFAEFNQSNTQQCRSHVFPIGDRILRFIDTPGVGNNPGFDQDMKNFQEILNFIAQYEHLNSLCILLKPNDERLNVLFRFCVNELLRHLHVGASENLIFIYTNPRSTFFMPGTSKQILQKLLDQHRIKYNVHIPFSRENVFLVDNELFRYLALRKHGIILDNEQTQIYSKSWSINVKEYSRLMERIVACPLHAVSNTLSLNEAEQLIRKLTRPIAETFKLIQENIQLAQRYKENVLENPQIEEQGIPQNNPVVKLLTHPRTVCVGENCCRVIDDGDEKRMEYLFICHDECYLNGVIQETLSDPKLKYCSAMSHINGLCTICGCYWMNHKHITYEYIAKRTQVKSNDRMTLTDIDKRITDLRAEEREIQNVYKKLAGFLHANAILPINDDIVAYLEYFIQEEQMKQSAGARNTQVIAGLRKMMNEFKEDIELLKTTLEDRRDTDDNTDIPKPEDIFTLVDTLYRLPINGRQIREQVNGIRISQDRCAANREHCISLPNKAAVSNVMTQIKEIISNN